MRLIHRVAAFTPHAILSRMLYQPVLRACWSTSGQVALKSYYRYASILGECWPGCHSDSHAICCKDWSGTSQNQTAPPKLVGSSHRHQSGQNSLVLPPRLDRSDYSEPCVFLFLFWYRSSSSIIIIIRFISFPSSLNKNQIFLSLALLPSYSTEHIDRPSTLYDILRQENKETRQRVRKSIENDISWK